ncbi:putative immune-responsive protein [Xylaria arbuscula]|nr:putative immune-responsive protein [Xylaria arbuscula]
MASIMASTHKSSPTLTAELCQWVHSVQLSDVPGDVIERMKHLILDGLACAIVGSHLPWSESGTHAILSMEGEGSCSIWGWQKKVGPLAAALVNSSFVQGFELDDYHAESPIHSSSVVLPALFALSQHIQTSTADSQFMLAALVGYELGPRIGFALRGGDILSRGWHSGAVFGPAAAAAASSKLLALSADKIEDALGIACTQACGLMSAQQGSMVKRMQHGFASRNGLFSALMASQDYTGIKSVLETPYGGFISTFGNGCMRDPPTTPHRITQGLGTTWEIRNINVKPYASMAATHGTIDCIRQIQDQYPGILTDPELVDEIIVEMSDPAFKKGGWTPMRPPEFTSAQMSAPYVAACQIVDKAVLAGQFTPAALDRDELWTWVNKIRCVHNPDFDKDNDTALFQRMRVIFHDESREDIQVFIEAPRGVKPLLTNLEIREKWTMLTQDVIDVETRDRIEHIVLSLGSGVDLTELLELLGQQTKKLRGF